MIEHGSYRIVGNNFQIDSVIQQNNILKKQNSNLKKKNSIDSEESN